jgi:hypothetical protein
MMTKDEVTAKNSSYSQQKKKKKSHGSELI